MKEVTNSNFADILAGGKPVLVDFGAAWCGPCRALAPIVEEVAEEYGDKVEIVKCDVDQADEVAAQCGIRNIPVLMYFKDGKMVDRSVGVVAKDDIVAKLNSLL